MQAPTDAARAVDRPRARQALGSFDGRWRQRDDATFMKIRPTCQSSSWGWRRRAEGEGFEPPRACALAGFQVRHLLSPLILSGHVEYASPGAWAVHCPIGSSLFPGRPHELMGESDGEVSAQSGSPRVARTVRREEPSSPKPETRTPATRNTGSNLRRDLHLIIPEVSATCDCEERCMKGPFARSGRGRGRWRLYRRLGPTSPACSRLDERSRRRTGSRGFDNHLASLSPRRPIDDNPDVPVERIEKLGACTEAAQGGHAMSTRTSAARLAKQVGIPKSRALEAVLKARLIAAVVREVSRRGMTHAELASRSDLSRSAVTGILSASLQKVTNRPRVATC